MQMSVLYAESLPGSGIMMESDTDLVVEYEEYVGHSSHTEGEGQSLSDSNTVYQDQDSFSILEGESLLESEGPQLDMPPLFVHITCSVNMKNCHGSIPIQTLPTCLGESCLTLHFIRTHSGNTLVDVWLNLVDHFNQEVLLVCCSYFLSLQLR